MFPVNLGDDTVGKIPGYQQFLKYSEQATRHQQVHICSVRMFFGGWYILLAVYEIYVQRYERLMHSKATCHENSLASVLEMKIKIFRLNFRFNKEKLHSLVTERCYPVSLSFDDPWDNSVLCFIVLNLLFGCIVFRRWQGVTDTRRSAGGLWSPWSHPEWSMPAALTWSPKATCMGRWRFACTPSRYSIVWVFVCVGVFMCVRLSRTVLSKYIF